MRTYPHEAHPVRYHEINGDQPVAPDSHPYVATVEVDPADRCQVEQHLVAQPGLQVLGRADGGRCGRLRLYVGCADRRGRDALVRRLG